MRRSGSSRRNDSLSGACRRARDGGPGRRGGEKEDWVGVGETATDLLQGITGEVLVRRKLGLEVVFVDRLQLHELPVASASV